MTDEQHPRAGRRENPPERRTRHTENIDCAASCPVAIRNAEQIESLFRRMDEEREDNKTRCEAFEEDIDEVKKDAVKWSHFSWIVGSMFTVILCLMLIVWNTLTGVDAGLERSIKQISEAVTRNSEKISITVTRINDFIDNHETIYQGYVRYQDRIANKLDKLTDEITQLQRAIHSGNRQQYFDLHPQQRRAPQ